MEIPEGISFSSVSIMGMRVFWAGHRRKRVSYPRRLRNLFCGFDPLFYFLLFKGLSAFYLIKMVPLVDYRYDR